MGLLPVHDFVTTCIDHLKNIMQIFPTLTQSTIKDTWTKPRGRVEAGEGGGVAWGGVEGWGENADNCN